MAFKVGDVIRLKSGGAAMTVSKLFKSPEGRQMVQCTWFDKKPREHRAAYAAHQTRAAHLTDYRPGALPSEVLCCRPTLCNRFGTARSIETCNAVFSDRTISISVTGSPRARNKFPARTLSRPSKSSKFGPTTPSPGTSSTKMN